MLRFLPFVLWDLSKSLHQQMFCTMKKLQPTFSSESWKQNQTLLRGAQYRWGNAHNFQWGKLQLEIRKKIHCEGGQMLERCPEWCLHPQRFLNFTEPEGQVAGADLDSGPALGMEWLQHEFSVILWFLSYHKSLCATSEAGANSFTGFTLLCRPAQNTKMISHF